MKKGILRAILAIILLLPSLSWGFGFGPSGGWHPPMNCDDGEMLTWEAATSSWICSTGTGTGDLLAANNLSDVADLGTTQANLHIDSILTALGLADDATHFGLFDGSTLSDNLTAKALFQELETATEARVSAASDFGADNLLLKSDGSGKGSQATGITVDDSDNITGVASITVDPVAAPESTLTDSDAPDTDKYIGGMSGQYVSGAAGSENSTVDFNVMEGGAKTSYMQMDGPNAQMKINKPLVLLSSDDPDTAAANQITYDTDGWLRVYSTSQKALARIQEEIHVTVVKPQDMADAVRDAFLVWSNESGMSFVITGWKAWAGTDDTTLNIETTAADGTTNATVDAVEIATDGTGVFTAADTTITAATIANGSLIWLDFDDTDDPTYVKLTIYGYYNADVN